MKTIGALVVIDAVVAWWRTGVSTYASTAEAAVGVDTSGIDIAVVCLTLAFIDVDTDGSEITRVGVKVATIVELTHALIPGLISVIASTSVAAGTIPSVILT